MYRSSGLLTDLACMLAGPLEPRLCALVRLFLLLYEAFQPRDRYRRECRSQLVLALPLYVGPDVPGLVLLAHLLRYLRLYMPAGRDLQVFLLQHILGRVQSRRQPGPVGLAVAPRAVRSA